MRKIQIDEVLDLTAYGKQRNNIRTKMISIKKQRRIHVGPRVTYLFENYDTMWYQVQEMTRAERIVEDEGVQGELNVYNELIPEKNQLSASLLIEISDIEERKEFLGKIVDLPDHTYVTVDNEKILPEFDSRQGSEDKLSSVQYVKFNLSDEQVNKFQEVKSTIVLGFNHPEYSYDNALTPEQKKILHQDLVAD